MMYDEFCKMLDNGQTISMEDYKKIEFVYTWSELIPNYGGKQKIVELFKFGGMELIEKLIPSAKIDKLIYEKRQIADKTMERCQKLLDVCQKFDEVMYEFNNCFEISDTLWNKNNELLDISCQAMEDIEQLEKEYKID